MTKTDIFINSDLRICQFALAHWVT